MLHQTLLKAAPAAALAVLLFAPAQASADPPDGSYFFDFDGANELLVVSGDADLSAFFPFAFLCEDFDTKASGKLVGNCDVDIPNSVGGLDGKVKGRIDRKGDRTVLKQKLRLKGKIRGGGRRFDLDYKFDVKATLDDGDDQIKYKVKVKACVDDQCSKESSTTQLPAVAFSDIAVVSTDWTLDLDVATNAKNKIKGTAEINTAEGQTIQLKAKGKYKPGTDTAKIKLKKGRTSLKLVDTDVTGDVMTTTIKYKKVFGNANSFLAVSTPTP